MTLRKPGLLLALATLALALPAAAQASQALTVQKQGSGSGLVTSSPVGIECGPTCQAPFPQGATVALRAVPGPNTAPAKWSGCDSLDAEGRCLVAMSAARTVTATLDLAPRTLTVAESGLGATSSTVTSEPAGIDCGQSCQASFPYGTAVTLTAAPGPNVKPAVWTGCDAILSGNRCRVTMGGARSVGAAFDPQGGAMVYPLSVERRGEGQGTVTGSPGGIDCGAVCSTELIEGSTVTLSAAPSAGSAFDHWYGGGCSGTVPTCTTKLNRAKTVRAFFSLAGTRTLSVSKAGSGQGTVSAAAAGIECGSACSAQVPAGKTLTLRAKAAKGSSFAHWSGACSGTAKSCKVKMSQARSVTAVFSSPQQAAAPPAQGAARCAVPRLKGKTLKQAKKALRRAHCSLGKVSGPKGRRGSLRVRSSKPGAGKKLKAGAKVDVKLGAAQRQHKRRR